MTSSIMNAFIFLLFLFRAKKLHSQLRSCVLGTLNTLIKVRAKLKIYILTRKSLELEICSQIKNLAFILGSYSTWKKLWIVLFYLEHIVLNNVITTHICHLCSCWILPALDWSLSTLTCSNGRRSKGHSAPFTHSIQRGGLRIPWLQIEAISDLVSFQNWVAVP